MAYFGYRKVKPVLGAARDYSACTITNTNFRGNPRVRRLGDRLPGQYLLLPGLAD